jgi:hypothetical protein
MGGKEGRKKHFQICAIIEGRGKSKWILGGRESSATGETNGFE